MIFLYYICLTKFIFLNQVNLLIVINNKNVHICYISKQLIKPRSYRNSKSFTFSILHIYTLTKFILNDEYKTFKL